MPLTFSAKGSPGNYKPCPEGPHVAICNIVADLGLQPGFGAYPEPKQQVYVRWEIPSERVKYEKDGKQLEGPQVINKTYTASMHEKAGLRKDLEAWRGRRFTDEEASHFDIGAILGQPCLINVMHKVSGENIYANVSSIMPVPKQLAGNLRAENELLYFAQDSQSQFQKLPPKIQEKIKNPAKQNVSNASGIYSGPEMASQYNHVDKPQAFGEIKQDYGFKPEDFDDGPPLSAYEDEARTQAEREENPEQFITDDDLPDNMRVPF